MLRDAVSIKASACSETGESCSPTPLVMIASGVNPAARMRSDPAVRLCTHCRFWSSFAVWTSHFPVDPQMTIPSAS